jgi:Saf4/Yju2 protein
VRFQFNIGYF